MTPDLPAIRQRVEHATKGLHDYMRGTIEYENKIVSNKPIQPLYDVDMMLCQDIPDLLAHIETLTTDRNHAVARQAVLETDVATLQQRIETLTTERDEAHGIVKSIAMMTGWNNVPPQRTLETTISVLNARAEAATEAEVRIETLEQEKAETKQALIHAGIMEEHGTLKWVFTPKERYVTATGGSESTRLLGVLNQTRYLVDEIARRESSFRASLSALVETWREKAEADLDRWPRGAILQVKRVRECADELASLLSPPSETR